MNVYTARWLLPVTAPPVRDGAVGVAADGRIAYVGPAADAPPGARHALGDAVLLPGLVAVDRGRGPDGDVARDPRPPSSGVTTFATTLATTFATTLHDVAPAHIPGVAPWRVRGPIGIAVSPAYAIDEDLLIDLCASAVGAGAPIALTVGASPDEVAFLREASGPHADARRAAGFDVVRRAHSAVHLLAELGIAAVARPLLVGAAYFDASDVALAAYYDCPVAYAPAEAERPDPASLSALLDAGVRVALATHNPLGLAARLAPDAASAVRLATLGAARALDVDHEVGSLEVGKQADLCAFALPPDERHAADALGPERALLAGLPPRAVLCLVGGHPLGGHPVGGHPVGGHPVGGHPVGGHPVRPRGV